MAILKKQPKPQTGALTKRSKTAKTVSIEEQKTGQEQWDTLLATPESDALLILLVEQAKQDVADGKFDEEDW
jgi:hypothetical protein